MLRLVEAPKEGQEKRSSKKPRSTALSLTPQESNRLRAAIRTLRRSHGGYAALAAVVGVEHETLSDIAKRKSPGSFGVAVLLARVAGITLEALLSPLKSVNVCPTCGAQRGGKS
jgi:DNA-binding XRE family transcriptional regulator